MMRLLILLAMFFSVNVLAVVNNQFIRDGGFELGVFGLDVETFPRYVNNLVIVGDFERSKISPISGKHSLIIPGRSEGGSLLTFETFNLLPGEKYNLKVSVKSEDDIRVDVEVDKSRWKKIYRKTFKSKKGALNINTSFSAGGKAESFIAIPHMLRLRVFNKKPVKIDNISLTGRSISATVQPDIYIRPETFPGVYKINSSASFIVFSKNSKGSNISFKIIDVFSNAIIKSGFIQKNKHENIINVPTNKRGSYEVRISYRGSTYSRQYVVINPTIESGINSDLFSICAEENGRQTYENVLFESNALYKLASEIGVSNVRVFSLAMPDILSKDGKLYDYTQLDKGLELINKYNMRPMIELGSNVMSRLPAWMRTNERIDNEDKFGLFNIPDGIRVLANKERFMKQKGGLYLDLNIYNDYLSKVLGHLKNKNIDYEIWNEPGYKFTINDFSKVIEITRNVINKKRPGSTLVGFSSTVNHDDINKGSNSNHVPSFLGILAKKGFLEDINVLSYHNRHAYLYYGPEYDQRNLETGFESELKEVLKTNKKNLPIWSTEFGLPWRSRHESRVDFMGHKKPLSKHDNKLDWDYLEVSRQLPMAYASALANGVKKLFWFSLDSGVPSVAHTRGRFSFFDGQMEPMPHIAVYDAVSELLSDVTFMKKLDSLNGGRIYIFKKSDTLLILGYNMIGGKSVLKLPEGKCASRMLDIVGRNLMSSDGCLNNVPIGSWPKYIFVQESNAQSLNTLLNNITLSTQN